MKKLNYYFTLFLVMFVTLFSFFNMFQIVQLSNQVITIVVENLLPSLLPFMILISLCLSLGILNLFSYVIQWLFTPLFSLSPIMSSIYFISFFCGYPTNVKMMKEAYELGYIDTNELQHLLSIASFSSISFIFISLQMAHPEIVYICHILPSILMATVYHKKQKRQTLEESLVFLRKPHMSFVSALKGSLISSCYAFIFILGYMLVFQFLGNALSFFIKDTFILVIIQGILEFSSGNIQLLSFPHTPLIYAIVCFNLSFSGISVLMQTDNLLENINYSFFKYIKSRIFHAILSFIFCYLAFTFLVP
ncbi:MAG: nucleoside recognition domain-containing protein [Coprobacillaceae bacterium]